MTHDCFLNNAGMTLRPHVMAFPDLLTVPPVFFPLASFTPISLLHSASYVISDLRYRNVSIYSNLFPLINMLHSFIHSLLYSAFSIRATQKRSQPQHGRIMLF